MPSREHIRARIELEPAFQLGDEVDPPAFEDPNLRNLASEVSIKEPRIYGKGNTYKVLAVDCGMCALELDREYGEASASAAPRRDGDATGDGLARPAAGDLCAALTASAVCQP